MIVLNPKDKKEYEIHVTRNGENAMTCPVCSEGRKKKTVKCFSFNLQKGAGKCAHCDVVLIEKKEFVKTVVKIEYKRPEWKNHTQLSDGVVKWFSERKISQKTLIELKVSEGKEFMPQVLKERYTVQFNYFRNGELVNIKYRDKEKNFKLFKDAELIFYNLDSVKDAEKIIIVEGEMDCLALHECGIKNCISVPNGANINRNNLTYLDNCIDFFRPDAQFVLALDNDQAGQNLRDELARRLGFENCTTVIFKDCKDANDCLIKYGPVVVNDCISEAKEYPINGVFTIKDLDGEIDHFYANGLPKGFNIGMTTFDECLKFQPGYITTITGIPGHGKSEVLDFICIRLNIIHGWRFAMYSPENHPLELHFSKLAEKLIGKSFEGSSRMNPTELNMAKSYCNENFYFIKPTEDFTLDSILDTVRQLVRKKGITGFVIDAWNKLEHQYNTSETQYISKQLDKLALFCETNKVHLFLVAHPTKIQKSKETKEYEIPNLYSISGSANFYNKTANGFSVYRDFENQKTEIHIQKVKFKHWGQTGMVTWRWVRESGRYYDGMPDESSWLVIEGATRPQEKMETNTDFLNDKQVPF